MSTNPQDGSRPTVVLVHGAFADGSSWNEVIERLQVEEQFSMEAEIKSLFQDMHLVWAALGATAAMLFCLIGSISVLHAANQERPDSLAGLRVVHRWDPTRSLVAVA